MPAKKISQQYLVFDISKLCQFIDDADENGVTIISVVAVHKEDWDDETSPEYIVVFTVAA